MPIQRTLDMLSHTPMSDMAIPAVATPRLCERRPIMPRIKPATAARTPRLGSHQPNRLTRLSTSEVVATPLLWGRGGDHSSGQISESSKSSVHAEDACSAPGGGGDSYL